MATLATDVQNTVALQTFLHDLAELRAQILGIRGDIEGRMVNIKKRRARLTAVPGIITQDMLDDVDEMIPLIEGAMENIHDTYYPLITGQERAVEGSE